MADQQNKPGCDQLRLDLDEVRADSLSAQSPRASHFASRVVSFAALKEDHLKNLIEDRVRRMGVFDL